VQYSERLWNSSLTHIKRCLLFLTAIALLLATAVTNCKLLQLSQQFVIVHLIQLLIDGVRPIDHHADAVLALSREWLDEFVNKPSLNVAAATPVHRSTCCKAFSKLSSRAAVAVIGKCCVRFCSATELIKTAKNSRSQRVTAERERERERETVKTICNYYAPKEVTRNDVRGSQAPAACNGRRTSVELAFTLARL